MDIEELFEKLKSIYIEVQLLKGADTSAVELNPCILGSKGIDSLDLINFIVSLESEFDNIDDFSFYDHLMKIYDFDYTIRHLAEELIEVI
tara:strand:+ start:278 stop:547 length:270 start_codon:yes stop_codon:yes gene_type:complete